MFSLHSPFGMCISLVVYVDNIIIIGDDFDDIPPAQIPCTQPISDQDLGPLKYFLGIEVAQSFFGVAIS